MPTEIFHFVKSYVLDIATRVMHVFPLRGRDKHSSQEKSARFEESSNGRKPEPSDVGSSAERRSERLPDRNSDEAVPPQTPKETKSGIESSTTHPNPAQKTGSEAIQPSNGTGDDQDGDREAHEQSANACKESATKDSTSPDNVSAPGIASDERDQTFIHRNDRESESKIQADSIASGSLQIDPIELVPSLPDDANEIELNETEAQTDTPIGAKTGNPKPKTPREIGGRRSKGASPARPDRTRDVITRPELQCRKTDNDDAWEIVISADEDCQVKSILHDGKQLHLVGGTCSLQSFRGQLSIVLQNDAQNSIELFDGNPLVFKLSKDWSGAGRLVKGMTKGHYIVFVPCVWNRTGHVPIESDACTDEEFMAHYFYADGTPEGGDSEGFQEFEGQLRVVALELMGKRLFDDSENGDLFVGEVPRLPYSNEFVWARVGDESPDGWRGDNFKPGESDLASVLRGRQGHFFVRVYNAEQMLDGIQFRYLRDLKEILLNDKPYSDNALLIPPPGGHDTTEVRFVGIDGSQTRLSLNSPMLHVKQKGSSLFVDPHPEGDCVSCKLESGTGSVGIKLKLPRVWWRLEHCSAEQTDWHDTPISMMRHEFIEIAHAGSSIRMILPSRVKSARFGFSDQRKSEHQLGSNRDTLMLDEFVDNECIADIQYTETSFEAEVDGIPITLIRIAAAPVPKIVSFSRRPKSIDKGRCATLNWETRNAESGGVFIETDIEIGAVEPEGTLDVKPEKTTKYTLRLAARGIDDVTKSVKVTVAPPPRTIEELRATVKSAQGGCRKGKGFSPSELQKAGLTSETANPRTLRVDPRRRTTHISNVESLRRLTNV